MAPLKVTIVCSAHPPGDVRIHSRWVLGLHNAGINVSLIAPRIEPIPEMPREAELVLVEPYRSYLSRARHAARVLEPLEHLNPDVAIYADPELHLVMLGYRKRTGCAVVFDRHENFDQPETLYQGTGLTGGLMARMYPAIERYACRRLDGVIVVIPSMLENLPPETNAIVAHNYPTQSVLDALAAPPLADTPAYTAVNLGAIQANRGYQHSLELAKLLVIDHGRRDFSLCLGGKWDPGAYDRAEQYVTEHGLEEHVNLLPRRVPHDEVLKLYRSARIGFSPYLDNAKAREQLQNKVLEFMAAGLPVITSPSSINQQIVEAAGCGALFWADELEKIADTIERWMDIPAEATELGHRGQQYVRQHLVWENELARVRPWLEQLVDARKSPS